MKPKTIGLFVGSLRKESISKRIAKNVLSLAPKGFRFEIIDIGNLPFYNQDFDDFKKVPKIISDFREKVKRLDGVFFCTPEYNRSVPAVLKNAIDIASRPHQENAWNDKPGGIITSSTGAISGFGANHHLRQSLTFVNVLTMQQPEAYLGHLSTEDFTDDFKFKDNSKQKFIEDFVHAYINWFNRLIK